MAKESVSAVNLKIRSKMSDNIMLYFVLFLFFNTRMSGVKQLFWLAWISS